MLCTPKKSGQGKLNDAFGSHTEHALCVVINQTEDNQHEKNPQQVKNKNESSMVAITKHNETSWIYKENPRNDIFMAEQFKEKLLNCRK